jgi:hypothetical protein
MRWRYDTQHFLEGKKMFYCFESHEHFSKYLRYLMVVIGCHHYQWEGCKCLTLISFSSWLIDYLLVYVPLKNFSLLWRRYHCRWRAANIYRPLLGAQGLWAGRDFYRATLTVTPDLSFFWSHPKGSPIQSPLPTCMWMRRTYSNPEHHEFFLVYHTYCDAWSLLLRWVSGHIQKTQDSCVWMLISYEIGKGAITTYISILELNGRHYQGSNSCPPRC